VFPAFSSFTLDLKVALNFPPQNPQAPQPPGPNEVDVLFKLHQHKRPKIEGLSDPQFANERECLLHPFSMVRVTGIGEAHGRVLIELSDVEHVAAELGPSGLAPQVTVRFVIEGDEERRTVTVATNATVKDLRKAIKKSTQRKDLGYFGFKAPAPEVPLKVKATRFTNPEPLSKHWRLGKVFFV
jgi:hypothetical protein